MKILSAEQLRQADAYTIENEPISSLDLMERAATLLYDNFKVRFIGFYEKLLAKQLKAIVLCGGGNNGGDGLVLARLLHQEGVNVEIYHIDTGKTSNDFLHNQSRLEALQLRVITVNSVKNLPDIDASCVVFDAIFGSGLNRPIEGNIAKLIDWVNKQKAALKIAIDIPSGLFASDNQANKGAIFQAHFTFTFQSPKLCFMLADWSPYVGDFQVIDIQLHQEFLAQVACNQYFVTTDVLRLFFKVRNKFSHKGNFGHVLVIAGSAGKYGAAVLASASSLRVGSGLVTLFSNQKAIDFTLSSYPEVMGIETEIKDGTIENLPAFSAFSTVAIGPGLGTTEIASSLVKQSIQSGVQIVLDADALNCLAMNKTWLHFLTPNSILTPHPKEFDRLFGEHKSHESRLETAKRKASELGVIIILKGAHSAICCPDGFVFFNSTGNPGMATAGSGDVLTGIIAGLLAQNYSPKQAAILGVYLHGLSADIATEHSAQEALIASDIINYLGIAIKTLHTAIN